MQHAVEDPKRKKVTNWEVACYWTSEEGAARLERLGGSPTDFIIDLYEAHCFACGFYKWGEPSEAQPWRLKTDGTERTWTSHELERAHLVPHAKGGPGTPDNLVLLCGRCHRAAPDCLDPDVMLAWMLRRQSRDAEKMQEISEAFRDCGLLEVDPELVEALLPLAGEQVKVEKTQMFGYGGIKPATVLGYIAQWVEAGDSPAEVSERIECRRVEKARSELDAAQTRLDAWLANGGEMHAIDPQEFLRGAISRAAEVTRYAEVAA